MANWIGIAADNLRDASKLNRSQAWRSATSRLYYALYCGATAKVARRAPFAYGRDNPHHSQLPNLVDQMRGLSGSQKDQLRKAIKRLFRMRVQADYDPQAVVDMTFVKEAFRVALPSLDILGVKASS